MKSWALLALSLAARPALGAAGDAAQAGVRPSCRTQWTQNEGSYRRGESYADYTARAQRTQCRKEWTTLIYMAADNDLSPYAGWDLYEMEAGFAKAGQERGASTPYLDVVVQLDSAGAGGVRRYHMFESPTVYQTRKVEDFGEGFEDRVESPLIEKLPEIDSADARNFAAFLKWGMANYPSEHYFVVIWGHGHGWADGGIAMDAGSGATMKIPDLHEALRTAAATQPDARLDVFAADSCLMQTSEVLTEISDSVRYAIGTTQISSLLGLPYRRLFWEMNHDHPSPFRLAKLIPELFRKSLVPHKGLQGRIDPDSYPSLTSSAVATEEFTRQMMPALKGLSQSLVTWLREKSARTEALRDAVEDFDVLSYEGSARDLSAFMSRLKLMLRNQEDFGDRSDLADRLGIKIDGVQSALDESLVNYQLGSDYSQADRGLYLLAYRALSIWIPFSREEFRAEIPVFAASKFYRETLWQTWMDILFADPVAADPPLGAQAGTVKQ